ncbi:MAG: DHH family phosphoesterase [Lachnospiraceae bacterium]|nr:DHH family phosphoesterase [Lachnospiraceae bacterium]MDD3659832.1 DHH family phosphoesterase [Lachnospiraceae bacterium]
MKTQVRLKGRLKIYLQAFLFLGVALALLTVLIFFVDYKAGFLLSLFVVLYFAVNFLLLYHNKNIILNELISFATQYGQIQKKLLKELDLPHALLDDSGRIIWVNNAFEDVTYQNKCMRKAVNQLFPAVTKDKLPLDREESEVEIIYDERNFLVRLKKISLREMIENSDIIEADEYEGFLIALYLFDETALKYALQENDDQSLAVGLIYIDNYDEALDSIEEVRRSLLVALIDRKVNKYVASLDGIIKKTEKDKYLVILRKKSLKHLQETKFEILEEIKTVNIGNDMSVTLSIGIGLDGLSYSQNYEFARTSIDLALGRGGDQAVVKTMDSLSYYGGKSQVVEKNTRVKARVKAYALREIVSSKDKVIVMGHHLTDVDSFGAAIGVYCIAKALQRKTHIVINEVSTSVKPLLDLFAGHQEYETDMFLNSQQAIEAAGANTVLVIVDVNRPSITECPELLKICKSIVVLDHHRQSSEVIENATLSYVEPYASSACEMVAEILQYIGDGIKIRGNEADCLYSGIIIDTNNFVAKTGVRTFEAAAFLRRNGADVTRVRKLFREDASDYKAKAETVRHAEIYRNDYAISICPSTGIESPTIVGAQAANELLDIKGIKASFVLTEYQGRVYISARSIDEVNVHVIMEKLGGGGHMNMAGAQLEDITILQAEETLKRILDSMIQEGDL